MAKKLNTAVSAVNPDTGETVILLPGVAVPGWAQKAIQAPDVWEADEADPDEHVAPLDETPDVKVEAADKAVSARRTTGK